jgi:hypothetical protein
MSVMKEYVCAAHGEFEARTPKCPRGCSSRFVRQEFRTAPAARSGRTKLLDKEMRNLATDYRLPDIRVTEPGMSVMDNLRKNPSFAPSWGQVDHAAPGFSQRGDAKTFNPASMGVAAENVLSTVKPILHQPRPAYVNKPDAKQ